MPASMATKLGLQFARFAQYTVASNNASQGLRNAFANATNGTGPAWTPGLNAGGGASSAGTGVGGAKFQAGKGAHSSFQHTGRALANANASTATDSTSGMTDEDDEANAFSTSRGLHTTRLQSPRLVQNLRSSLAPRLIDTTSTLHLIAPSLSNVRTISTARKAALPSQSSEEASSIGRADVRPRQRSLSTSSKRNNQLSTSEGITAQIGEGNGERVPPQVPAQPSAFGPDGDISKNLSDTDPALIALYRSTKDAMRNGTAKSLWHHIDKFVKLPKEKKTSPGFNVAMDAIWRTRDPRAADRVLELYEEMLQVDCAPNNVTYASIVKALCVKDLEHSAHWEAQKKESVKLGKEAPMRYEDDFHKALSILDFVHTSSTGFYAAEAYDSILYSCAIRGDAETACLVIERLSANKNIRPTATSFSNFMKSFALDTIGHPGESREDFIARRLKACEHVMDEFEIFRQSKDWNSHAGLDVKVWNEMIAQYIRSGYTEKAMELIEKMVTATPYKDGSVVAPPLGLRTAQIVILSLLDVGDVKGAIRWFRRVLKEQSNLATDGRTHMPMPQPITIALLFKRLLDTLPSRSSQQSLEEYGQVLISHTDDIKAANLLCDTMFKVELYDDRKGEAAKISDASWRQLLDLNSVSSQELFRMNRLEDASNIVDHCLNHIKRHVDLYQTRLSSLYKGERTPDQDIDKITSRNVESITRVIDSLVVQGRSADAASCFTYAVAIAPYDRPNSIYPAPLELLQKALLAILHCKDSERGYEYVGKAEDAKHYLSLLLAYLRPSAADIYALANLCDDALCQIFMAAQTHDSQGAMSELDFRGRNALLRAVLLAAQRDGNKIQYVPTLFDSLAKLPQEERDLINVQEALHILPRLFEQDKALEMVKKIRASVELPTVRASSSATTSPANDSLQGEYDGESVLATESNTATSETAASTLAESATPPPMKEYVDAGYEFPAMQTIDVDFGQMLLQMIPSNISRRNRNGASIRSDGVEQTYETLKKSIEETGTYPSPDALVALIDQYGRRGDLEKVKELYAMASNVVASLGGEPQWQMDAWCSLENIMTSALAHGGEPKLASEHRHRLLNAGRAPSADTYGALITVIRDATDEALVAEELFDESQRLGVRPTRYLYNTVLSKLSRARKSERAMQLFEEMRNRGVQPSSITYGALLNACTRTGDIANAERFFSMMESDVNFKPMAPPYNTMMQLYVQTRPDRERALHYHKKLVAMKVQPTTHTYKLLLDMYGSLAPIDLDAMRTVFGQLIADPFNEVQGNHWASLITAYGIHYKDMNKAIEVYESIPQHVASAKAKRQGQQPDSLSFEALLTVFAEHQRIDLIEKYVEQRKKSGSEMTAYIANGLIKAYSTLVRDDGLDKARAVFEEMEDPPMGIAADGNHPIQRQHVSGIQMESEADAAEESIRAFRPGFRAVKREPSTFEAMIRAEMEHQNQEQAEALINRMQYRGYPPVVVARAQEIVAQHTQPAL